MNPLQLMSNDELCQYLLSLSKELERSGKSEASGQLTLASHFAFGSPSEFLHEAAAALVFVRVECKDVLTSERLRDLESVVERIKAAFQRIGGA
jgi:hypothetical protein